MPSDDNEKLICDHCSSEIEDDDDFCPHCGSIFSEDIFCEIHSATEADGVCIICCTPCCPDCGGIVNDLFLCNEHAGYEIIQGMARVYGVSDNAQAEYVHKCLEEEGFHPFIFSRKASPISIGGGDHTLFRASGEYDGHIINEIKIMAPCQEVVEVEKVLQNLDLVK